MLSQSIYHKEGGIPTISLSNMDQNEEIIPGQKMINCPFHCKLAVFILVNGDGSRVDGQRPHVFWKRHCPPTVCWNVPENPKIIEDNQRFEEKEREKKKKERRIQINPLSLSWILSNEFFFPVQIICPSQDFFSIFAAHKSFSRGKRGIN